MKDLQTWHDGQSVAVIYGGGLRAEVEFHAAIYHSFSLSLFTDGGGLRRIPFRRRDRARRR